MLLVSSILSMHRVPHSLCEGHFIMIINFFFIRSCYVRFFFLPDFQSAIAYITYNTLIVKKTCFGKFDLWEFLFK